MKQNIVIIGGGHAGIEAADAVARLGVHCTLVTLRKDGIGQMSCNPAIGGLGKGQIVKEVDALGGLMGMAIDATGIQFRVLNESRGPAVRSSRAQADRKLYKNWMQNFLSKRENLTIIEGEVASILTSGKKVNGVELVSGEKIPADAIVLTSGTFLRGLMHTGPVQTQGGRLGDRASNSLSDSLTRLGFNLGRLKTGTPARLDKNTIDYSKCEPQYGDNPPRPFSMFNSKIEREQLPCWITSTNEEVHSIIERNKEKSPMFNGQIKSGGPRYCPSIEDKVFRFNKPSHQIFLEPEGYDTDLVYPNGISTSLPVEVQEEFIRKIKGLENVRIIQHGYAVEYDFVDPRNLFPTLETKEVEGLFLAGQINGTSGYEEAAGQGLVAGVNAALKVKGEEPFILSRTESYIGVMIDDLTSQGVDEPYRMFTSRAEFRLLIRDDNTAFRMCPKAVAIGLLDNEKRRIFEEKQSQFEALDGYIRKVKVTPTEKTNTWLAELGSSPLYDSATLEVLNRRPELGLKQILKDYPDAPAVSEEILEAVETESKFAGYIKRQKQEIESLSSMEKKQIPADFDYYEVDGLRREFQEKLTRHRPVTLGQASRIPGITPTVLTLLAFSLKERRKKKAA